MPEFGLPIDSFVTDTFRDSLDSLIFVAGLVLVLVWRGKVGQRLIWYRIPDSFDGLTIASDEVLMGEPATSLVKVRSTLANCLLLLAVVYAAFKYHASLGDLLRRSQEWTWAMAAISIVALSAAFVVNFVRTIFNWTMRRAAAMICNDRRGRYCLSYIGDVPPLIWQYRAWPRVLSFATVLGLTTIGAFSGSAAISIGTRIEPAPAFCVLFATIWILPYAILALHALLAARANEE